MGGLFYILGTFLALQNLFLQVYVLTSLLAGHFTLQASKPGGESIGLADTLAQDIYWIGMAGLVQRFGRRAIHSEHICSHREN